MGAPVIGILLVIAGGTVTGLVIASVVVLVENVVRRRREALAARDQVGRLGEGF